MPTIRPKDEQVVNKVFDKFFEKGEKTGIHLTLLGRKIFRISWITGSILIFGWLIYLLGVFNKKK